MRNSTRFFLMAFGAATGFGSCFPVEAADSTAARQPDPGAGNTGPAPMTLTAQQDHQKMMERLHIASLRQGANPNNTNAPNAVNYDEAKANPYPHLPDPLVLKDGQRVTTAEVWWKQRRPEIVEDFDREIYGRVPKDVPSVNWEVRRTTRETNGDVPVITKQLVGRVDNSSCPAISVDIQLTLTTPAKAVRPVPVMMEFGFGFGGGFGRFRGPNAPGGTNRLAGRGFGAGPGATNRPGGPMGPGPGGFGGFGGGGPTWQEQVLAKGWGYAILTPNSIQADTGAGLTKGIIGLCNKGQPRKPDDWGALRAWAWGASRALDYFETDKAVDAKQVGIEGVSAEGKWVDQRGSFMAAAAAGPVYRLLGKKDLGTTEFPPLETGLMEGELAWRQHAGGHTTGPNWPVFLRWADRYMGVPR